MSSADGWTDSTTEEVTFVCAEGDYPRIKRWIDARGAVVVRASRTVNPAGSPRITDADPGPPRGA